MDIAEFEDFLDRHGDDISGWPVAQQRAAAALLLESVEARGLLREAQTMRSLLSSAPIRAPKGLADRVVMQALSVSQALSAAPAQVQSRREPVFTRTLKLVRQNFIAAQLAFLLACFVAGALGGVLHSKSPVSNRSFDMHDFFAYVINMSHMAD